MEPFCANVFSLAACELAPRVAAESCPATCGLCRNNTKVLPLQGDALCEDENDECLGWAANGECDENPRYMWVSCTASCRLCVDPDGAEGKPKNDLIDAYEGENDNAGAGSHDSDDGHESGDGADESAAIASTLSAAGVGGDGAASKAESEVDVMDELTEDDVSDDKAGGDADAGGDVDDESGADDGDKAVAHRDDNAGASQDVGASEDVGIASISGSTDEELLDDGGDKGFDDDAAASSDVGVGLDGKKVSTSADASGRSSNDGGDGGGDGGGGDRNDAGAASCEDVDAACPVRAKAGKCASEPVQMRADCPQSCDLCHEAKSCVDKNELCNEWAAAGECSNNPGYMLEGCPVSCNTCNKLGIETKMDAAAWRENPLARILTIATPQGEINICLRPDNAPKTVAAIVGAASTASHRGGEEASSRLDGEFYRTEPVPDPLKGEPIAGPPYALLQGSLHGLPSSLPKEGFMQASLRNVCTITGTSEFFVSLGDHPGWGKSFTIWGTVVGSLSAIEALLKLPAHDVKHPTYGTVMRTLDNRVPFNADIHTLDERPETATLCMDL